MTAISPSDVIFATVRQRGSVVANLRLSGLSSLSDLYSLLSGDAACAAGIATVDVRNGSQGWQQRHTLMLRSAA